VGKVQSRINDTVTTSIRKPDLIVTRKSPYIVLLTKDQRYELVRRSRKYTLSYSSVIRAKIILMAAEGLDNSEIAARLDIRREIVSKWRKRFFERGLYGLEEGDRSGRPLASPN
jgi:DNA-binding CsgD family transcriptional regulator